MMNRIEMFETYAKYDTVMKTRELGPQIPYLRFKEDWEVQVSPPFGGATARFRVRKGQKEISVYLDCYDFLGCVGEPYWELHPNEDDDCDRFLMNETEKLIEKIDYLLSI